jgi:hypothetical protein
MGAAASARPTARPAHHDIGVTRASAAARAPRSRRGLAPCATGDAPRMTRMACVWWSLQLPRRFHDHQQRPAHVQYRARRLDRSSSRIYALGLTIRPSAPSVSAESCGDDTASGWSRRSAGVGSAKPVDRRVLPDGGQGARGDDEAAHAELVRRGPELRRARHQRRAFCRPHGAAPDKLRRGRQHAVPGRTRSRRAAVLDKAPPRLNEVAPTYAPRQLLASICASQASEWLVMSAVLSQKPSALRAELAL